MNIDMKINRNGKVTLTLNATSATLLLHLANQELNREAEKDTTVVGTVYHDYAETLSSLLFTLVEHL